MWQPHVEPKKNKAVVKHAVCIVIFSSSLIAGPTALVPPPPPPPLAPPLPEASPSVFLSVGLSGECAQNLI